MDEATSFWIFELNDNTSCSRVEHGQQFFEPLSWNEVQQPLAVFEAQVQVRCNQIREMAGMLGV